MNMLKYILVPKMCIFDPKIMKYLVFWAKIEHFLIQNHEISSDFGHNMSMAFCIQPKLWSHIGLPSSMPETPHCPTSSSGHRQHG